LLLTLRFHHLARSKLRRTNMTRYPSCISQPAIALLWLTLLCAAGFLAQNVFSAPIAQSDEPKIECLLPNGQFGSVQRPHNTDATSAVSVIDDTTVSCPLRAGETTFVIALPKNGDRDRLTFVNENMAASGELKIAVSDSRLDATSPKWTQIDGIIPFSHKRLFNVSLVGIETRFVRLTFNVESATNVTSRASSDFRSSALATAINSHFAKIHSQRVADSVSFGSLTLSSNLTPNE
jgi:hypothetical protein